MKRFSDAIAIQGGACNPVAIANALVRAIDEIKNGDNFKGTAHITGDPAVRLIVHQLAFICNVAALDAIESGPLDYTSTVKACEVSNVR